MNRVTLEVFDGKTTVMHIEDGKILDKKEFTNMKEFLNLPHTVALACVYSDILKFGLMPEETKIAKKQIFLSWSDEPKRAMLKRSLDKIFALEVDDVLTLDMDNITGIKTAYYKAVKGTDKKFTFNRVGKQWKITRLR